VDEQPQREVTGRRSTDGPSTTRRKDPKLIAPQGKFYSNSGSQELLIALRGLLSRNPSAAQFSAETLAGLLYAEGYFPRRLNVQEVECALDVLRVEGEVLP
jgi:hypothetical protein